MAYGLANSTRAQDDDDRDIQDEHQTMIDRMIDLETEWSDMTGYLYNGMVLSGSREAAAEAAAHLMLYRCGQKGL
jgi:hypothetical protein